MQLIESELLDIMNQKLLEHESKVKASGMQLSQINEKTTKLDFSFKGKTMSESISTIRTLLILNNYE